MSEDRNATFARKTNDIFRHHTNNRPIINKSIFKLKCLI